MITILPVLVQRNITWKKYLSFNKKQKLKLKANNYALREFSPNMEIFPLRKIIVSQVAKKKIPAVVKGQIHSEVESTGNSNSGNIEIH